MGLLISSIQKQNTQCVLIRANKEQAEEQWKRMKGIGRETETILTRGGG